MHIRKKKSTGIAKSVEFPSHFVFFAWWVRKYIKGYTIIQIQALGVVIPLKSALG